jgi:type IX secretion system PorP/SprF family membrane protein
MRIVTYILIFIALHIAHANAQSLHFSNFFENRMFYNPAFVANNNGFKILSMTNKLMFRPNSGPFTLNMASLDLSYCKVERVGIGLMVSQQNEGDGRLRTNMIRPVIGIKLKLNDDWLIRVGFNCNFQNNTIDWSKLVFSDQIDPVKGVYTTSTNNNANWNQTYTTHLGTGIIINTYLRPIYWLKRLWIFPRSNFIRNNTNIKYYTHIGLSYNNFGKLNDGLLQTNILPGQWVLHAGTTIPIHAYKDRSGLNAAPYARLIREDYHGFGTNQDLLDIGLSMQTKYGYVFTAHRNNNSIIRNLKSVVIGGSYIMQIGHRKENALRINISADINYNSMVIANNLNWEFGLNFLFNATGCSNIKVSICDKKEIGIVPPF